MAETSAQQEHRVVFTPSGLSGRVPCGTTVLEAAREMGVDLDTVCGGRGICGRCQVVPGEGTYPKWGITVEADDLSPPGPLETDYRGRRPLGEGHRLGCALEIRGDVVIDVPRESQIHKQVVRKGVELEDLVIDPMIRLHYLVVPPEPEHDQGRSALERIRAQLAETWDLTDITPIFEVLPWLHPALELQNGEMTVAIREGTLITAWPGYVDRAVGVAIDIGSTTIAGHLVDLASGEVLATAGRMNPQIRFGEDLMSRVSYVMMNPGGATALTAAVQFELDNLVTELVDEAGVDRGQVLDLTLVGNPIMHHLVLGIDPTPLGQSPFTLATSDAVEVRAPKIGISNPAARVYVGPCIAGHVGADTAAAILAEGPHRSDRSMLLVDVGTNAEIVLGDGAGGLWAASSPTGPAFEGAQLSSGQRATTGAVERVRIDPDTLEPRIRVIGCEAWSDEPGFVEGTARTGITGVCGSGIIEVMAELFLAGVVDDRGVIRAEAAQRTDRVVADERTFAYVLHRGENELRITQGDVRAVQLAKAALRAGVELLLERAGYTEVDEIRLAGAFGAHIDPMHAMVLGLIPDAPLHAVRSVGNAAGAGAVRALVSRQQREEMEQVVRTVTKVETATEPRFQELFVAALGIPHRSASTAHLAGVVTLPQPGGGDPTTPKGRRRRQRPAISEAASEGDLSGGGGPVEVLQGPEAASEGDNDE
jgi:uncharacterized 2Fe-2S/4Fe-4S cluster protein (DUF4445 family)